jgi:hypothetical protein
MGWRTLDNPLPCSSSQQDSRSEHERQYLLCQGSSGVENTELVKSPRWDWHWLMAWEGSWGAVLPWYCGPFSAWKREGELLPLGRREPHFGRALYHLQSRGCT